MMTSSPIPSLKETTKEADWSWMVSALRQDPLIWTALNNPEFFESANQRLGNCSKRWNPINLAFLILDENILIDDLRETPLKILNSGLHRRTIQAYDIQTSESPPEMDLQQAGLLALYLYENPEVPMPMAWTTTLSCLLGLVSNPIDFLSQLNPCSAIQVILSQPLPVGEQKEIFVNLLTKTNFDHQISLLQELSKQRFEVAASIGQDFFKEFSTPATNHRENNFDKLLKTLSNLVMNAELQFILDDLDEYRRCTHQAWNKAGKLYLDLAVQSIISNIYNHKINEASVIWTQNKNELKPEHFSEIILNLEKQEITRSTLSWFDDDFISNNFPENNNPDQNLASGIIAYYQEKVELSYTKACKALDGYFKTNCFNPDHVFLLSRLFLALTKPAESIQAITLVLDIQPNNLDAILLLMKSYQTVELKKLTVDTAHLASALAPDKIEIRRFLADSLEIDQQWVQALEEREAIIRHPKISSRVDYHKLAACALSADQPQRTAAVCQKLLNENPDDAEAHRLLGEAYLSLGDPLKAQSHFIKATQISPDSVNSWIALAELYQANDQKEKKWETLHAASNAIPDNPEIQYALGKEHYQEKSFTNALHAFQNGDRLVKTSNISYGNKIQSAIADYLGKTLYQLGHIDDALEILESAYQKDPGHVGVAHMYGKTLLATGFPERAVSILYETKKTSPDDLDLNLDFARACIITSNELEEAKESLLKIIKICPQSDEAIALLAEAYELNQEYDLALEAYQDAVNTQLRDDPTWNTRLSLGLGRTSLKLDQPEMAIAALKSALVSNNDDIDVHKTLSNAYLAADLKDKALSVARSALSLDPDDDNNLDWFIQQAITLDATDKAIEALKEFQKIDPNKSSLLTKLGWLYLYEGDAETALNTFNQVKTIDIISPLDLYKVSQGFLAINDPTSAVECLDKAIYMSEATTENDELARLFFTKTTAQQMVGDIEGALKTIEESLLRIEKTPEIIKKQSKILFDLDRHEEAISCLEYGIKDFPQDEALIIQAITLYRAKGDLGTAVRHAINVLHLPDTSALRALNQSTAAIISDLADAMLQTKLAKEIIDNADSVEAVSAQPDLAYYCLLTKLALDADEDIAAADAITSALKIDPKHPRVLALQARLTSRQGDFDAAKQTLQKGLMAAGNFPNLNQPGITTGDLAHVSVIEQPASTYIELADVCILFQHWSVAIFLLQKAIDLAPNEPRSYFALARALVLRAEYQRLCQSLDVVNNAPGKSTIAEFAYKQFENAILKAAHLITEITTPNDITSTQNLEPKSTIAMWLARGQAIFQPSLEHARALSRISKTPDNQAAYIAALRYCRDYSRAINIAHQIFQVIEKQISDPLLSGQIALTLTKESVEIAAEAVQTAIKVSNWLNSPNRPIYYAIQADIARNDDDHDGQLRALQFALEIWPDESKWLSVAADLILNQSNHPDHSLAIKYLEQAILLEPKKVSYHLKLADVHHSSHHPKDVLRVLEKATHVIPKHQEPWLALARAYQHDGDIPQAIRCAKMVVQIDPNQTDAHLLLAEVALEVDNPNKAFKYLDNILTAEPENSQALLLRSRTYKALGKPQEALRSLDIAILNLPKSIPVQLERIGLIRQAKGDESALEALNRLNEENPNNPHILAALAEVLSINGEQDVAIQTALDALPDARQEMKKNEFVQLLQLLGRLLRKSGQLDQAIHNLSEAVEISPEDPGPYFDLGRCYQDQRQYDRALQNFRTAIDLDPDNAQAYYFAGLILKETKDYENAELMFKKAANLSPTDLNIHRQLGAVTAINLVHNCQEQPGFTIRAESTES